MDSATVVVVSDSHLSSRTPEALTNWDAVVALVDELRPELVVHLGDLSLDGASGEDDLILGRQMLDRLPVAWRCIPGNHDIGDNPNASTPAEYVIDSDRLAAWRRVVGPDFCSTDLGGWTLVAINAQLAGSGLADEEAQWAWLAETFDALPSERPVVLATHKPIHAEAQELLVAPAHRFVAPSGRRRLAELMSKRSVPVVLSGHVHQYRRLDGDGRQHWWAPTTWAVMPASPARSYGVRRGGVLVLSLDADQRASARLVEPPGLAQLVLGDNVSNPYES